MAFGRITSNFLVAASLVATGTTSALARPGEPDIVVRRTYYDVSGRTASELKRDMQKSSSNGFWAFTRWQVSWSASCHVTVSITMHLPRLRDRAQVSLPLRNRWDRMIANLRLHESGHAQNALNAGRAVLAADCQDPKTIVQKWMENDKVYDEATGHGRSQGVTLDN